MDIKSLNLTTSRLGIVVLAVITSLVHLFLCLDSGFDIIFFMNFLGYLALTAAFILPIPIFQSYHRQVRWAFMAFTAITIIAWIFVGLRIWFAYPDKVIEAVLLVLLWFEKS
jgi:hypothetical protein